MQRKLLAPFPNEVVLVIEFDFLASTPRVWYDQIIAQNHWLVESELLLPMSKS